LCIVISPTIFPAILLIFSAYPADPPSNLIQQLTTHHPCTIVAKHLPCSHSCGKAMTSSQNCILQQSLVTLSGSALCLIHMIPYSVRHRMCGVKPRLCSARLRLYSVRPRLSAIASLQWASTSAKTLTAGCSLEHQPNFDQSTHDNVSTAEHPSWTEHKHADASGLALKSAPQLFSRHQSVL